MECQRRGAEQGDDRDEDLRFGGEHEREAGGGICGGAREHGGGGGLEERDGRGFGKFPGEPGRDGCGG